MKSEVQQSLEQSESHSSGTSVSRRREDADRVVDSCSSLTRCWFSCLHLHFLLQYLCLSRTIEARADLKVAQSEQSCILRLIKHVDENPNEDSQNYQPRDGNGSARVHRSGFMHEHALTDFPPETRTNTDISPERKTVHQTHPANSFVRRRVPPDVAHGVLIRLRHRSISMLAC